MKNRFNPFTLTLVLFLGCTHDGNLANRTPDFTISAGQLIKAFEINEETANEKYKGKIIETLGQVIGIEKLENGVHQLILECPANGRFECSLGARQNDWIPLLTINKPVKVKGICAGKSKHLVLEKCVIVQ